MRWHHGHPSVVRAQRKQEGVIKRMSMDSLSRIRGPGTYKETTICPRGQQNFSCKGQIVNTLAFVGHIQFLLHIFVFCSFLNNPLKT